MSKRVAGPWSLMLWLAVGFVGLLWAGDDPAPNAARAGTLPEAAAVLDLRTLPLPEGAQVVSRAVGQLSANLGNGGLEAAAEFFRDRLKSAGWTLAEESLDKERHYASAEWTKAGYLLRMNVFKEPQEGKLMVYASNHGNVDARSLPRPEGAELKQNVFYATIYRTTLEPDAAADFIRAEMKKQGWREVTGPGGKPDKHHIRHVQGAVEAMAMIQTRTGQTEVMYGVRVVKNEMLVHGEVTSPIEYMDEPPRLVYVTRSEAEELFEFYKKELAARGWKLRPESDKQVGGAAQLLFDIEDGEPLRVEMKRTGEVTWVSIGRYRPRR